jgi:signal transduction histidine kinase
VALTKKNWMIRLQLTIFRIVQEQLNDILKHANATWAAINLTKQRNEITLLITDNGNGCNSLEEEKGVGIINIRSRAELYRGTFTDCIKARSRIYIESCIALEGP